MEKYFKRLPQEMKNNGNQKVHSKIAIWKKQKMEKIQKIKKSFSEYRAEKVTGFTNRCA